MPETTDPEPNKSPEPDTITVTEPVAPQTSALNPRYIVAACSAALCGCFFLPWISWLFFTLSGFQLARQGENAWAYWIMPALALITCLVSLDKHDYHQWAVSVSEEAQSTAFLLDTFITENLNFRKVAVFGIKENTHPWLQKQNLIKCKNTWAGKVVPVHRRMGYSLLPDSSAVQSAKAWLQLRRSIKSFVIPVD